MERFTLDRGTYVFEEHVNFGVRDRLGREIGAIAVVSERSAVPSDGSYFPSVDRLGSWYHGVVSGTRNGQFYGACQSGEIFPTRELADAYVAKRLVASRKAAAKKAAA